MVQFIDTESGIKAARDWREGNGEFVSNGDRVFIGVDEKVLEMDEDNSTAV